MKVTFVYPRFRKFLESVPDLDRALVDHFLGNFTTPPSLGIPVLAALTPPDVEVELVDDNKGDPPDFGRETDLVAINCFTPQATRAFEIADGFRAAGRKVVMGGIFPSTMPDEALRHADAVNIGDGEPTWPRILEDARHGRLAPRYEGGTSFDLADMPIPRREIFTAKSGYDWREDLVQLARGCTYNCHMCAIPSHAGRRIRLRPVDRIVDEIRGLRHENVYLADDTIFFPGRKLETWTRDLLDALAGLGKKLFVSSTMALDTSDDLLDRLARAGARTFYCTLNVDPKSIRALGGDRAARQELCDLVSRLEDRGVGFFASFGIGRDWDGPDLVDSILDLGREARIRTAEFFIFTPYPGSPHFERLERQGRLLHRRWEQYNGAHVVARPLSMDPERLAEMYATLWREFYRPIASETAVEHLEPDRSEEHMRERRQRVGRE